MGYTFRPASENDLDAVFSLYEKRIQWMNEKGIRQWNVTDYLDVYPLSYYRRQQALGDLYVLLGDGIIGAVVLARDDDRWSDKADSDAYYVHNLVTDPAVAGAGKRLLAEIEQLAKLHKKQFIRLDCAVDNAFLNRYYASLGYELSGTCKDGAYLGNRREKRL